MDDIVRAAMAKWPNVPACHGWLGLDKRGNWYMRDAQAQRAGPFAQGGAGRGSLLQHAKLIKFIERNYAPDALGQWYFQNGPQRVYVELESTPWIWRVSSDLQVRSHTGLSADITRCLVDELGWVYLESMLGLGLVHSQDVVHVAQALEQKIWLTREVLSAKLPVQYAYVQSPQLRAAESASFGCVSTDARGPR